MEGIADEEDAGSLVLPCAGRKVGVQDALSLLSGMICAFPANAANSGQYDFALVMNEVYPSLDRNSKSLLLLME